MLRLDKSESSRLGQWNRIFESKVQSGGGQLRKKTNVCAQPADLLRPRTVRWTRGCASDSRTLTHLNARVFPGCATTHFLRHFWTGPAAARLEGLADERLSLARVAIGANPPVQAYWLRSLQSHVLRVPNLVCWIRPFAPQWMCFALEAAQAGPPRVRRMRRRSGLDVGSSSKLRLAQRAISRQGAPPVPQWHVA